MVCCERGYSSPDVKRIPIVISLLMLNKEPCRQSYTFSLRCVDKLPGYSLTDPSSQRLLCFTPFYPSQILAMSASNRSHQLYPYDDDLSDINTQMAIQASLQANARSHSIFPTQPVASSSRITIEGDERIITPSPSIGSISVPASPSSSMASYAAFSVPTSPSSSSASYSGTESVFNSPLWHIGMSDAEMMTASLRPSLGSAGERLMSPFSPSAGTRHHVTQINSPIQETDPLSPSRMPSAPRLQSRNLSPEMTTIPPIVTPVRRQGPSDDSWNDSPVPSAPQSPRSPSDGLSHRTNDQPHNPVPYETYSPANQNIGSSPSQSPVIYNSRSQWFPASPPVTTPLVTSLHMTPPSPPPPPPPPVQTYLLSTNLPDSTSRLTSTQLCGRCRVGLLPTRRTNEGQIIRFSDPRGVPFSFITLPALKIEGFKEGCLLLRCRCNASYCRGCGGNPANCPDCPSRAMVAIFEVLRLFDLHYLRFFANEELGSNTQDNQSKECQFLGLYAASAAAAGCTANIMAFAQTLRNIELYANVIPHADAPHVKSLLECSFLWNVVRSCLSHAYLNEHLQANYANLFYWLFRCLKSLCRVSPIILESNRRIRSSPGIGSYLQDSDDIRWFDEDVTPTLLKVVETYRDAAHGHMPYPGEKEWFPPDTDAQYQYIIRLCSSGHA